VQRYIRREVVCSICTPWPVISKQRDHKVKPIDQVLREPGRKLVRRGMIVIISTFDDPEVIMRALRLLRHRRNEVIVFHVLDKTNWSFLSAADRF
jgi:hypothetical protein